MKINVLTPRACCLYLQAVIAWLPRPDTEYEDDEMSPEEIRHFEELERQLLAYDEWLWNHIGEKNHGKLSLRWTSDGVIDLDLDKPAVHRLLHFLCDERVRRQHDTEYDC